MCTQRKGHTKVRGGKGPSRKPRGDASEAPSTTDTLILDFQPPEQGEIQHPLLKPPSLGGPVMAALANHCSPHTHSSSFCPLTTGSPGLGTVFKREMLAEVRQETTSSRDTGPSTER